MYAIQANPSSVFAIWANSSSLDQKVMKRLRMEIKYPVDNDTMYISRFRGSVTFTGYYLLDFVNNDSIQIDFEKSSVCDMLPSYAERLMTAPIHIQVVPNDPVNQGRGLKMGFSKDSLSIEVALHGWAEPITLGWPRYSAEITLRYRDTVIFHQHVYTERGFQNKGTLFSLIACTNIAAEMIQSCDVDNQQHLEDIRMFLCFQYHVTEWFKVKRQGPLMIYVDEDC